MRISNYPTDTLTGEELILATDVNTSTKEYKTVNFSVDTLKTFLTTNNEFTNIELGGSIIFEGATANNFETTLSVTDPTADRTINLPNASGTIALASELGAYLPLAGGTMTGNLVISNETPTITFTDTTTNEVSGKIKVDGNSLSIQDGSGNEKIGIPLTSSNSVQFNNAIFVDTSASTYNELQNETQFWGDVKFKNADKNIIIDHRGTSGNNYINSDNTVGGPEIQFHNTNANGSDDRLIRMVASTGSGSSGDWGGRLFIYTRINGGNSFNSFKFDDAGAFTAPKFKVSSLNTAPASATAEGTAGDIIIADDAIYVCVTTGSAGNAAWKKATLSTF